LKPARYATTLSAMRPAIPVQLKRGAFRVSEAYLAGFRWDDLQTKYWARLSRGQYVWTGIPRDTALMLRAVAQRMPVSHAFSGPTAAWLLGLDLPPCQPIEVTVDRGVSIRSRAGVRLRRALLPESDVVTRRGFRTTSALRTARDLGSGRDLVESVVALDLALHAGLVNVADLARYVSTNAGAKGVKRLRRAVHLAEPKAESPMETRLRMQLVTARLPRPCVQVDLHSRSGDFLGRADLYYPDRRLVIEYDGENHKDRRVADLQRQNRLINAGYHLLRFTAADLRVPGSAPALVRQARVLWANNLG
jgi:very-short-patch-repair endonuclease